MLTKESYSQLLTFLVRILQGNETLNALGYDRACQFIPFLRNLAKKGNPAAEYLLQNFAWMVDKFHIATHTKKECRLDDPACEFHPDLDKFEAFNNPNTECAEQVFSWASRHAPITKKMHKDVLFFYLHVIITIHNNYILSKSGQPPVAL